MRNNTGPGVAVQAATPPTSGESKFPQRKLFSQRSEVEVRASFATVAEVVLQSITIDDNAGNNIDC